MVGSGFLAHWKNLAFTQNQDDKLVSIIGGEAYMNIYIVRAKCWLDVKQEWMGDPYIDIVIKIERKTGVNGVVNFLSRVVAGTLLDRIR